MFIFVAAKEIRQMQAFPGGQVQTAANDCWRNLSEEEKKNWQEKANAANLAVSGKELKENKKGRAKKLTDHIRTCVSMQQHSFVFFRIYRKLPLYSSDPTARGYGISVFLDWCSRK